jgi:hypothetical protein
MSNWGFRRSQQGAVLPESAFILALILFLLFTFLYLMWFAYAVIIMNFALNRGCRIGTINAFNPSTGSSINLVSQVKTAAARESGRFGVPLKASDMVVCRSSSPGCTSDQTPAADEFFYVKANPDGLLFYFGRVVSVTAYGFGRVTRE